MASRKTKNPRISFVPSDQVSAVLAAISAVNGKSRARQVSELMTALAPVLLETLKAEQKLKDRPEEARAHIEALAANSHARIDQAVLDLNAPHGNRGKRRASRAPTS